MIIICKIRVNTNIRWVIRADVLGFDQILKRFGPVTSAGLDSIIKRTSYNCQKLRN